MPKKWTVAHKKSNPHSHYHFQVWLDDTKTLPDGSPDPAYLMDVHFPLNPPNDDKGNPITSWTLNGTTYNSWESYIQAEIELLAQAKLASLTATDTTLTFQGTTF